jgi:GT2 family glycosyltransferase
VNKQNRGFAKGLNQGARIAQGDYILLLNNDTIVFPDFLTEMENTFAFDAHIGIVGCLIFKSDTNQVQHAGVQFTKDCFPYELGLEIPEISKEIPKNDPRVRAVRNVPAVTGCCMMIKKKLWNEIGGLDEEYINGWEDVDFCLKAREKGAYVYYNGRTSIYHKHFGSAGRFKYERENRDRYAKIWVETGRAKIALGGKYE